MRLVPVPAIAIRSVSQPYISDILPLSIVLEQVRQRMSALGMTQLIYLSLTFLGVKSGARFNRILSRGVSPCEETSTHFDIVISVALE